MGYFPDQNCRKRELIANPPASWHGLGRIGPLFWIAEVAFSRWSSIPAGGIIIPWWEFLTKLHEWFVAMCFLLWAASTRNQWRDCLAIEPDLFRPFSMHWALSQHPEPLQRIMWWPVSAAYTLQISLNFDFTNK